MGNSIQDYLKKINSLLSFSDTVSIITTAVFLLLCAIYLSWVFLSKQQPIVYTRGDAAPVAEQGDSRPFGSRNGTTYTYSWCQGSERTKPENKIFFKDQEQAELLGRTLSKLCQK